MRDLRPQDRRRIRRDSVHVAGQCDVSLSAFGLNLPVVMATSVLGGLVSAWLTYRIFARHLADGTELPAADEIRPAQGKQHLIQMILGGGEEGFQLALKALPVLVLAVLLVNVLKAIGAIGLLETICGPAFALVGSPPRRCCRSSPSTSPAERR